MKWFRMYSEARTDAKLESLTDEEFRVWFKLLNFASEQETRGCIVVKNKRLLAVEVARSNVGLLNQTLEVLSELEIIRETDNTIQFIHWDKRQFESDASTNRWRKWRDKQQSNVGQTLENDNSNVGQTEVQHQLTPPDTDTDTDIKHSSPKGSENVSSRNRKNSNEYTTDFEEFWSAYPRKIEKGTAFKVWKTRTKEGWDPVDLMHAAQNYAEYVNLLNRDASHIKHASVFLGPTKFFKECINGLPEEVSIKPTKLSALDEFKRRKGITDDDGHGDREVVLNLDGSISET